MKDITSFCATTDIKPSLTKVFVKEENGIKIAVATDAFRLIKWEINDDFLKEVIPVGFYNRKIWKDLCSAYNKKKRDLSLFSELIKMNEVLNKDFNEQYPDFESIIPSETDNFRIDCVVNADYFKDFIDLIPKDLSKKLDFKRIRTKGKMLVYKDDFGLTILLMALNED
jgi:DNA polymerase III sliding clamp (beta) subunit (PCNA family)